VQTVMPVTTVEPCGEPAGNCLWRSGGARFTHLEGQGPGARGSSVRGEQHDKRANYQPHVRRQFAQTPVGIVAVRPCRIVHHVAQAAAEARALALLPANMLQRCTQYENLGTERSPLAGERRRTCPHQAHRWDKHARVLGASVDLSQWWDMSAVGPPPCNGGFRQRETSVARGFDVRRRGRLSVGRWSRWGFPHHAVINGIGDVQMPVSCR